MIGFAVGDIEPAGAKLGSVVGLGNIEPAGATLGPADAADAIGTGLARASN